VLSGGTPEGMAIACLWRCLRESCQVLQVGMGYELSPHDHLCIKAREVLLHSQVRGIHNFVPQDFAAYFCGEWDPQHGTKEKGVAPSTA